MIFVVFTTGFSLSLDRDRAIDAYMLANNWQQCFALALAGTHPGQGPVAVGKIGTLALEISRELCLMAVLSAPAPAKHADSNECLCTQND